MSQEQLLAAIERCHAAALADDGWPGALMAIADLTGGLDATLEMRRGVDQMPVFFASGTRLPDDGVERYLAHYAGVCPRISFLDGLAPGDVGCDLDFTTEDAMDRDEFYADFLAPDGLRYFLGGSLRQPHQPANHIVAVQRTAAQGHAGDAEVARLRLLLPHVGQAVDTFLRLRRHIDGDRQVRDVLEGLASGVVLLDGTGRAVHVNGAAAAIVRAGDGLSLTGGRLRPTARAAAQAFDAVLGRMLGDGDASALAPGESLLLPRPSGRLPFGLRVRRLPRADEHGLPGTLPKFAVFIDAPVETAAPDPVRIAAALGLTRRQAELAAALYAGQSLRAHAASRGIGLSTARFHLYQVLDRLGLHRQQDLIRLIASLPDA